MKSLGNKGSIVAFTVVSKGCGNILKIGVYLPAVGPYRADGTEVPKDDETTG